MGGKYCELDLMKGCGYFIQVLPRIFLKWLLEGGNTAGEANGRGC